MLQESALLTLPMDINLEALDVSILEKLFQEEESKLSASLLSGASWESLLDQRKVVTELATIIHKKRYPLKVFNPAEFSFNRNEDKGGPIE